MNNFDHMANLDSLFARILDGTEYVEWLVLSWGC